MEISHKIVGHLKELKNQLEEVGGTDVDFSVDKLINLTFPVASHNVEDGQVTSQHVFLPGKSCAVMMLLDVAGYSSTADDGKRVFLLSDALCSPHSFVVPVNLVATPHSETPCYATTTLKLVPDSSRPGYFNDVQIAIYTWGPDGSAAPNVSVDWRCRLPLATDLL